MVVLLSKVVGYAGLSTLPAPAASVTLVWFLQVYGLVPDCGVATVQVVAPPFVALLELLDVALCVSLYSV